MQEFLTENLDEYLHGMIRANVKTATRNFQHRWDAFMNEILMGKNNPMHITYQLQIRIPGKRSSSHPWDIMAGCKKD